MSEVSQYERQVANGVQVSESAKTHFLRGLARDESHTGVRLSLKKTGCSGLSYVVTYVDAPQSDDVILPFEGSYSFFVERASYPLLNGLQIDYVPHAMGHKLVFQNPNQTGQCGCGESFTVKIDK